jgi:hypothetical protein
VPGLVDVDPVLELSDPVGQAFEGIELMVECSPYLHVYPTMAIRQNEDKDYDENVANRHD